MRNQKVFIILSVVLIFFIIHFNSYSQCSDAGVCSIGSHKHMEEEETHTNSSITFGDRLGYSGKDDDITYNSIFVNGNFALSKNITGSFTMPFNLQSGPAGSFSGPGDLIIGFNYNNPINQYSSIDFQVGGKFATGSANLGDSLPLAYQSGLGTNDLLLGVTYNVTQFAFTVATQIPFGNSTNDYTMLERSPDVLLRMGYNFPASEKLIINTELLAIKRLAESKVVIQGSNPEQFVEIGDSDFLQLNVQASLSYLVSKNWGLNLSGAIPLLKRDTNVDGTKRAFTVSAGASYFFNLGL